MGFLNSKTSWSNIELGLIKVCATCSGISIGLYFQEYLKNGFTVFLSIAIITAIWGIWLWAKKRKE